MEEEKKKEVKSEISETSVVEESKQPKKKGNKVFIIVIILIALALAYGCGLYLGKKLYGKEEPKEEPKQEEPVSDEPTTNESTTNEPTPNEPTVEESKALSDSEIEDVMKRFLSIRINEKNLFKNDNYNISNILPEELLLTAFGSYNIASTCSDHNAHKMVTISDLNNEISKYVNNKLTQEQVDNILKKSLDSLSSKDFCYGFAKSGSSYKVTNCNCGSLADGSDFIKNKIVKGEKIGEYVYIYQKIAFAKYKTFTMSSDDKVNYYLNYARDGKVIETLTDPNVTYGDGNPNEGSAINWDLYNTYKYTFKNINGTYYFQSLELVK